LRHGDVVSVNPYWPSRYEDTEWLGRIKAFVRVLRLDMVLVETLDEPDDPLVQTHPFGALTLVKRVGSGDS
jgi:translation initiation factor IF-1